MLYYSQIKANQTREKREKDIMSQIETLHSNAQYKDLRTNHYGISDNIWKKTIREADRVKLRICDYRNPLPDDVMERLAKCMSEYESYWKEAVRLYKIIKPTSTASLKSAQTQLRRIIDKNPYPIMCRVFFLKQNNPKEDVSELKYDRNLAISKLWLTINDPTCRHGDKLNALKLLFEAEGWKKQKEIDDIPQLIFDFGSFLDNNSNNNPKKIKKDEEDYNLLPVIDVIPE